MKILNQITKYFRTSSKEITLEEAQNIIYSNDNVIFLDVRSPQEYEEGHLEDAVLIPLYELKHKINKIIPDKYTIIIAYCSCGVRSKKAIKVLQKLNYQNVYSIKDGINFF